MKKIFVCVSAAMVLFGGCTNTTMNKSEQQMMQYEPNTFNFSGIKNNKDYKATLISNDGFETAVFTDNRGNKYNLKMMVSASGTRLGNDDGVEVMFKKGEGVINLGKGTQNIFVSYDE